MSTLISETFLMFGITQQPTTVQEFLWDLLVLFVGFYIIKWVTVTFFSFVKDMMRIG